MCTKITATQLNVIPKRILDTHAGQTAEERFRQHQSVKKRLAGEEHNIALIKPNELLQSVEVLNQGRSKQELLVMEALFITDRKPPLNSQEEGADRVSNIF